MQKPPPFHPPYSLFHSSAVKFRPLSGLKTFTRIDREKAGPTEVEGKACASGKVYFTPKIVWIIRLS